ANASCICIAFQGMSFGGCNQYIDRIRITADKDIALRLLLPETDQLSACHLQGQPLKAIVENLNRTSVSVSDDTIQVSVPGISNQQFTYVYNKTLGGFESDTLLITGQLDLSANGAYYFEACMQAIDDNTANDTIRDSSLIVMQDIALDSVIGLDDKMFKLSGETVNVTAIAHNNGNIPVDKVIFHMGIDGSEVVADTVNKWLYPGDTIIHPMSRAFTVPAVSKDQPYYFFELKTELGCDADENNDAINIVGQVEIPDSIDIQVLEITTTEKALGKTKLSPTVRVANIGNMEAENIIIHVDVLDNTGKKLESISENISHMAVNETKNHQFTMNYKVPDYTGKYTLKAYVEAFAGDTIQSNDTLAKQFSCYRDSVGIRDAERLDWSLGQNIPNPATELTAIPFSLPQAGEATLTVMTANGQVIHRRTIQVEAGENRIGLDASGWAAGVYYYTMEYKGQRITRKMNIIR
ncbi:MAG: T9SS type A sorting domain-containing protein, partial [Bacteroidales bacterium]|nr:T9SS type A sorting domain-containing protein [Bacteroidales bacterium]